MNVVVPFAPGNPKTRLEPVLTPDERQVFARAMLVDVLDVLREAHGEPAIVTTEPLNPILALEREEDVTTVIDERPLTEAVNAVLADATDPTAVVMADLPLLTTTTLERLWSTEGDVVIAPGRGGGTNALVVRHPAFRVDYHGASYLDHRRKAQAVGATVETVDSFRLATDVDEPADLVEVLLHSEGRARECLEEIGLECSVRDGRVGVERR